MSAKTIEDLDECKKLNEINIKLNKTNNKTNTGTQTILIRFLYSLIPFNFKFKSIVNNTPDLIGPFCISILIIILSFFLINNSYLVSDNKRINNIIIFTFLLSFVYLFIFCIILLTTLILKLLGKVIKWRYLICFVGYSLNIFIPILLNLIFDGNSNSLFRLLSILFGIISSILFNFFNNIEIDSMNIFKVFYVFILDLICESILLFFIYLTINKINFLYLKTNIINIAISSNDEYKYSVLVLITSLLENKNLHSFYQIFLMIPNDNTKDKIINLINTLKPKYENNKFNITYLPIDSSALSNKITISGHITKESYFRLLLPSLLPQLDRIIYMDADVINFEDLTELYDLNLKDNIYVRGVLSRYSHLEQLRKLGVNAEYTFNAGILLINLKSFRKYNIEKKLLNFISTHSLYLHDQAALNAICYKNNELMHPKYNFMAFSSFGSFRKYNDDNNKKYKYNDAELYEALKYPVNLHYASPIGGKPWNKKYLAKREYWWYYANKTDYMKEIMIFANYSQELVDEYLNRIKKYPF